MLLPFLTHTHTKKNYSNYLLTLPALSLFYLQDVSCVCMTHSVCVFCQTDCYLGEFYLCVLPHGVLSYSAGLLKCVIIVSVSHSRLYMFLQFRSLAVNIRHIWCTVMRFCTILARYGLADCWMCLCLWVEQVACTNLAMYPNSRFCEYRRSPLSCVFFNLLKKNLFLGADGSQLNLYLEWDRDSAHVVGGCRGLHLLCSQNLELQY